MSQALTKAAVAVPMTPEDRAQLERVIARVMKPLLAAGLLFGGIGLCGLIAADKMGLQPPALGTAFRVLCGAGLMLPVAVWLKYRRFQKDRAAGLIATGTARVAGKWSFAARGHSDRSYEIILEPPMPRRNVVVDEAQYQNLAEGQDAVVRFYPSSGEVASIRPAG